MNYLFLIQEGLNEVMMSTALLRRLKTFFPETVVYYASRPEFHNVLAPSNYVTEVFDSTTLLQDRIEYLKTLEIDYIIDLENSDFSKAVSEALNMPKKRRVKMRLKLETRELNAAFFKLHIDYDDCGLLYMVLRENETKSEDLPASHRAGYFACPISSRQINEYPRGFMEEFFSKINHPVILLGDAEHRAQAEKYSSVDSVKIYNACGKFSFDEQADLVKKAKLVLIFGDKFLQLAASVNRPILLVEGKTPNNQNPLYQKNILDKPDLYFQKFGAYHQLMLGLFRIPKKDSVNKLLSSLKHQLSTITVRSAISI